MAKDLQYGEWHQRFLLMMADRPHDCFYAEGFAAPFGLPLDACRRVAKDLFTLRLIAPVVKDPFIGLVEPDPSRVQLDGWSGAFRISTQGEIESRRLRKNGETPDSVGNLPSSSTSLFEAKDQRLAAELQQIKERSAAERRRLIAENQRLAEELRVLSGEDERLFRDLNQLREENRRLNERLLAVTSGNGASRRCRRCADAVKDHAAFCPRCGQEQSLDSAGARASGAVPCSNGSSPPSIEAKVPAAP